MKLVAVTGGLGNQMFGYAFMVRLSKDYDARLFHPYGNRSRRYGHAGFQLEEVFNLRPSDRNRDVRVAAFKFFWHVIRLFSKRRRLDLLKIVGMNEVKTKDNFVFYPEVFLSRQNNELFIGTWQSWRYFEGAEEEVRKAFTFQEELLNEYTRRMKLDIESCNSVSLHVRRDDYLLPNYLQGFGGICTVSYYQNAIAYLRQHTTCPKIFVFSDDIDWCRKNLDLKDATFVEGNHDGESWQDMYLMSRCCHNIIANSTFSWWGAWLNTHPDKIVVAPDRWWNGLADDVVPEMWIRISGEAKYDS